MKNAYNKITERYESPMVPLASLAIRSGSLPWRAIIEAMGPKKLKAACIAWPLLHEALSHGNIECVELMLAAGANPNQIDAARGFPIANAQCARSFSMMVASGSKLNIPDAKGRTALQIISANPASGSILSMAAAAAQAESNGTVATFKEGQAAAKTKASDDIAQPLIEALFTAIDRDSRDRIKALWATLNFARDKQRLFGARDKNGRTLAHAAVSKRNFALLKRLADRGMDLNIFDSAGNTAASLLICLGHDDRLERGDRRGERRRKHYSDIAPRIDWSRRSPEGVSYFESLAMQSIETRNGPMIPDFYSRASATMPDWLEINFENSSTPSHPSCLLSRCLAKAIEARSLVHNSLLYHLDMSTPTSLHSVLAEQIKRPEFGKEQAEAILSACFSDKQAQSLSYARPLLARIASTIEANLPVFIQAGADPESISWCSSIASSLPTLHAAIESWRISNIAAHDTQGERRRSKSL